MTITWMFFVQHQRVTGLMQVRNAMNCKWLLVEMARVCNDSNGNRMEMDQLNQGSLQQLRGNCSPWHCHDSIHFDGICGLAAGESLPVGSPGLGPIFEQQPWGLRWALRLQGSQHHQSGSRWTRAHLSGLKGPGTRRNQVELPQQGLWEWRWLAGGPWRVGADFLPFLGSQGEPEGDVWDLLSQARCAIEPKSACHEHHPQVPAPAGLGSHRVSIAHRAQSEAACHCHQLCPWLLHQVLETKSWSRLAGRCGWSQVLWQGALGPRLASC